MISIPPALTDAISNREGESGRRWLAVLPSLVTHFCERWGCEVDGEASHGEVALVVPVSHETGPSVLKLSYPHPGNRGEFIALRHYAGHGAVRLLEADDHAFAMLLERAGPGTLAAEPSVEEAIDIAGHLAQRLAIPAPSEAHPLALAAQGWEEELEQQLAATPHQPPARVIERARSTIRALQEDTTSTMLHGDLHFANILTSSRELWLAIDPMGWSGTLAFDAFTVVSGRSEVLRESGNADASIIQRIRRYATAAGVEPDLAVACCQARATSSCLYQRLNKGAWFELEFLERMMTMD